MRGVAQDEAPIPKRMVYVLNPLRFIGSRSIWNLKFTIQRQTRMPSGAREFASVTVKDSVLRSRCQCDPPAVLTKYLNQFMIYKQITLRKSEIKYSAKRIPLAQHPNISPSRGNLTHGTPRHIHLNLWDMDIQ